MDGVGGGAVDLKDAHSRLVARFVQCSSEHVLGQAGQVHGMLLYRRINIGTKKPVKMRLT